MVSAFLKSRRDISGGAYTKSQSQNSKTIEIFLKIYTRAGQAIARWDGPQGLTSLGRGSKAVVSCSQVGAKNCDCRAPSRVRVQLWGMK